MLSPESVAQLKNVKAKLEAARDRRREAERLVNQADGQLWDARAKAHRLPEEAFKQWKAGGEVTRAQTGPTVSELELILRGAKEALKVARDVETHALGDLQVALIAALREEGNQRAERYFAAASTTRGEWEALAGLQATIDAIVPDHAADLVDVAEWRKAYLPSSEHLPALKGRGEDTGTVFHTRVLLANEPRQYDATAARAAAAVEQEVRGVLGEWPFGHVTGSDLGTLVTPPAVPPVKSSRRAVLEKAAANMKE